MNDLLDSLRHFLSPKFVPISGMSSFSTATGDYTNYRILNKCRAIHEIASSLAS